MSLEAEVERACKLLELATPEAMEASAAALESVARELAERRFSVSSEEASRIRKSARRARLLLDLSARFHTRWHDLLAAMTGGYTVKGAPADFAAPARISLTG